MSSIKVGGQYLVTSDDPSIARGALLPAIERNAYRVLGYSLSIHFEAIEVLAGASGQVVTVLKSAPVATELLAGIAMSSAGVGRMVNHPANFGILMHSVWELEQGVEGANAATPGLAGPWITPKNLVVPGVYMESLELFQAGSINGQALATIEYERIAIEPRKLAALAASHGWDNDAADEEFRGVQWIRPA